jgi:transcriptional regulator with XRE-family HTH domain
MAEAVGASPSTVRDWLAGRSSPTGERARRVAELAEITDRLARVIEARYIPVWMLKPIEALDDRTPMALIAAGEARRVARLVSSLESPGAA